MDKTESNSFGRPVVASKPTFIRTNGKYVMEPLLFMHTWNRASSLGDVAALQQQRWVRFTNEHTLVPDRHGKVHPAQSTPRSLLGRVKTFRQAGAIMKSLPKLNVARYDWEEIVAQSQQYADQCTDQDDD